MAVRRGLDSQAAHETGVDHVLVAHGSLERRAIEDIALDDRHA
jgi:hypothetical protein